MFLAMKAFEGAVNLGKLRKDHIVDFSWLASAQLLLVLLGFVSIKLTSSMGPAEYGKLALSLTLLNFLNQFL